MRSWSWIALLGSIVLNLFLVALIGGHLPQQRSADVSTGGSLFPHALASAEASLSPSDAAAFDTVVRRDAPHDAQAAKQLEEARSKLDGLVVAEPFNQEEVRQALAA
jgi:hypothetical protein